MSAAIYPTEPIYAGDTWPGIPAITIQVNAAPPAVPAASATLVFFKAADKPGGTSPMTGTILKSPDAVTITSAAGWTFAVPAQILPLESGEWTFQFKTRDTAGAVRTWLTGTLSIL